MSLLFADSHLLYRDLLFDQAGSSKSAYRKSLNIQVEREKNLTEACKGSKGKEGLCHDKVVLSFLHRDLLIYSLLNYCKQLSFRQLE